MSQLVTERSKMSKETTSTEPQKRELSDMEGFELDAELKRRGHTCMTYLKVLPPIVEWCEQEVCIHNKGG
jgi:hypothetical protein